MKRRWVISSFLLIVAGLILFSFALREPRYQGQTLTQWLDRLQKFSENADPNLTSYEAVPEWRKCQVAVRAMKKDALPLFDEWIQAKDSDTKIKITRWLSRHEWFGYGDNRQDDALRLHIFALGGYSLLGKDAEASISFLLKMTEDKDQERRFWAFYSLYAMKPAKEIFFPVLKRLLHDPYSEISPRSAEFILELYPDEAKTLKICEQFPALCNTNPVIHAH